MARAVIDASTVLTGIPIEITFTDTFVCDAHASPIAVFLAAWSVTDEASEILLALALAIDTITMTTAVPFTPLAWVEYLR
jgi:hypothetical protein